MISDKEPTRKQKKKTKTSRRYAQKEREKNEIEGTTVYIRRDRLRPGLEKRICSAPLCVQIAATRAKAKQL